MPDDGNIADGGGPEKGAAVRETFTAGIFILPAAVMTGHWCVKHLGTRGIERRLETLCQEVVAWQAAHDHQVEVIDRRMCEVEASAARAENEARMVSVQVAEMSESLFGRVTNPLGRYRPGSRTLSGVRR